MKYIAILATCTLFLVPFQNCSDIGFTGVSGKVEPASNDAGTTSSSNDDDGTNVLTQQTQGPPASCKITTSEVLNLVVSQNNIKQFSLRFNNPCSVQKSVTFSNVQQISGSAGSIRFSSGNTLFTNMVGDVVYVGNTFDMEPGDSMLFNFSMDGYSSEGYREMLLNNGSEAQSTTLTINVQESTIDNGGETPNVIACTAPNASSATQNYSSSSGSYGDCIIRVCDMGYMRRYVNSTYICQPIPTQCLLEASYIWTGNHSSKSCTKNFTSSERNLPIGSLREMIDNSVTTSKAVDFNGSKYFKHCYGAQRQSNDDNNGEPYVYPMIGVGIGDHPEHPEYANSYSLPSNGVCEQISGPDCSAVDIFSSEAGGSFQFYSGEFGAIQTAVINGYSRTQICGGTFSGSSVSSYWGDID